MAARARSTHDLHEKEKDTVMSCFWRKGALPGMVPGIVLALAVMFGVILAGCGSTSAPNTPSAQTFSGDVVAQQVAISADASGANKWDKETYEAQAGDITFVVSNPSPHAHQFTLTGNGLNYSSGIFGSGTTSNYTVKNLPAGEYQLTCNLHTGQVSKLVVH
jgi:plastocyanin